MGTQNGYNTVSLQKPSFVTFIFKSVTVMPFSLYSKPFEVIQFLSYFDEANVEFSCCVSSLQVTPDIDVIVLNNTCDEIGGRDPLCSLSSHKHSLQT